VGGGMANAIVGSIVLVGVASVVGMADRGFSPGVYLAESGTGDWARSCASVPTS